MRKCVTLVFNKTTGSMSFLHDDDVLAKIGQDPESVERLSNIEFEDDRWTVRSARSGRSLFSHIRRDECLAWEKTHVPELLKG